MSLDNTNVPKLEAEDLAAVTRTHSEVTKLTSELGAATRLWLKAEAEAEKLIAEKRRVVKEIQLALENAENEFRQTVDVLAVKYEMDRSKNPHIDLATGEISNG